MKFYTRCLSLVLAILLEAFGINEDTGTVNSIEITIGPDSTVELYDTLSLENEDSLTALEKEPVLKRFVAAEYPPWLSRKGLQGTVEADIIVNEQGMVDSVGIVRGIEPQLDSLVSGALHRFVFEPAVAAGDSVAVLIRYQYHINLDSIVEEINEYSNLQGTVLERGTRRPVVGASVIASFPDSSADTLLSVPFSLYLEKIGGFKGQVLDNGTIVTVTDSIGGFRFKSLPNGPCRISIPLTGYDFFSVEEKLVPGEVVDVIYRIEKRHYSEYEIVVYGKEETREVARRTLSVEEVRKIPGFSGDAVKVVQALPGVARPSFGGGTVVVRGAPTWDSKFYLDGIPIPQLYHFGGIKSTYNSDALESIDFYPGGFSCRYGGAVAGVVDLKGRSAKGDAHAFGDVNLLDATVFMESPVGKKASLLVTARRSYIGDLLGFAVNKLSIIDLPVTVAPFYYDYIVRSDIKINSEQKAFLTIFGSKDELELVVPFMRRGSSEIDSLADRVRQMRLFAMTIAGWDVVKQSGLANRMRMSYAYGDGYGSIFGFAKFDLLSNEYTLRDELSYRLGESLAFNAGLDMWWQRLRQKAIFPNADQTLLRMDLETDFGTLSPYFDVEFRPIPSLLIVPGIRFDYYHELQYDGSLVPEFWDYRRDDYRRGISGEPSLRLSARFNVTDIQTLKASVGTYNQTPQPQGFSTNEIIGNTALPATRARHIVVGYERRFTDLLFADVQVYHNRQWGIPEFSTTEDLLADPDGPRVLPDGEGRMYGLELLLRHDNSERFFGWIAYTLSKSERYNRREEKYSLYNRDQTHNLQLVASVRLDRQWEAGVRARFVSGNPATPIVGSVFDATSRFYRPLTGAENSTREEPFFQVDVRIDKKIVFDRWMLSVYLDMQNILVFIYQSPEFTVYNYDYTQTTSISSPFIPSLGIRAEF